MFDNNLGSSIPVLAANVRDSLVRSNSKKSFRSIVRSFDLRYLEKMSAPKLKWKYQALSNKIEKRQQWRHKFAFTRANG